jgi:hypothetical protein
MYSYTARRAPFVPTPLSGNPYQITNRGGGGGGGGGSNYIESFNVDDTLVPSWIVGVSPVGIGYESDGSSVAPGFNDETASQTDFQLDNGQNVFGGLTNAKKTEIAEATFSTWYGSGQRFAHLDQVNSYGMGDSFLWSGSHFFAGGNIEGDEGCGWTPATSLGQQTNLTLTTVTSVTRSSIGAGITTTQSITGSQTAQTVTVSSTTGISIGDWLVVDQEVPTNTPNEEAVEVIGTGAGTITAIFEDNHNTAATLLPALVLGVSSVGQMGQDRVLVNHSRGQYTTGTVSGVTGNTFTGSGTGWTAAVSGGGGGGFNIGAIALASDTYAGAPFNGSGGNGPLNAWFQILGVQSATALTIYSTSVANNSDYHGWGGTSNYTIAPCVKILRVIVPGGLTQFNSDPGAGTLVCDSTTATWDVSDSVECIICPYPDFHGYSYQIAAYSPACGALSKFNWTARDFLFVQNTGARQLRAATWFDGSQMVGGGAGGDIDDVGPFGFFWGHRVWNAQIPFAGTSNPAGENIGAESPAQVMLTLTQSDGNNCEAVLCAGDGGIPNFIGLTYNGSLTSPSPVNQFQSWCGLVAGGFDGSAWTGSSNSASVIATAQPSGATWTTGDHGTAWLFNVIPAGSTSPFVGAAVNTFGGVYFGNGVNFSVLPAASGAKGSSARIIDATVTTGNITTGGGSHDSIAYSNGTNWVTWVNLS